MTQPEVMAVLHRVIEAVDQQRVAMEIEPDEPPSLWQLAKKARAPAVRRGMGRALSTLAAVAEAEPGPDTDSDNKPTTTGGI